MNYTPSMTAALIAYHLIISTKVFAMMQNIMKPSNSQCSHILMKKSLNDWPVSCCLKIGTAS